MERRSSSKRYGRKFEGDLTPSDFEVNFHLQFAKTYAYHFSISAKTGFGKRQRNVFFKTIDDDGK